MTKEPFVPKRNVSSNLFWDEFELIFPLRCILLNSMEPEDFSLEQARVKSHSLDKKKERRSCLRFEKFLLPKIIFLHDLHSSVYLWSIAES